METVRADRGRWRVAPLLALALLSACARGERSPDDAVAPASSVAWTRPPRLADSANVGVAELPLLTDVDPGALADLCKAAPKGVPTPTGPDGGTAIGRPTGIVEPPEKPAVAAPEPARKPTVTLGTLSLQAPMANTAIERAARAQLYWPLVQRCRDPEGRILPPDAVRLRFRIDADGYITASSIVAEAKDARHEGAAQCMLRELAAAPFRAPAAMRGQPNAVDATVPSVD